MRNVAVYCMDKSGVSREGYRISIEIFQFMANGFKPSEYTNSEGIARFQVDVDSGAEIAVYVNGNLEIKRGPIYARYDIIV